MSVKDQIVAIESELEAEGLSVLTVLNRADVAPSTWFRWREKGVSPRLNNWEAVKGAAAAALAEKRAAA